MSKKKKMLIWIFIGVVAVVVASVLLFYHTVFSGANPSLSKGSMSIGNNTFAVEFATTMLQQAKGLSGRQSLAENDGMLFLFGSPSVQNFWMKDMNFAIDIIWIGDNKVLGYEADAQPQPGVPMWALKVFSSPDDVDTVLEVPAGTVAKDGIAIGDPVVISK